MCMYVTWAHGTLYLFICTSFIQYGVLVIVMVTFDGNYGCFMLIQASSCLQFT